ncbi:MAG TPA: diacylglycerol kinase family protein [Thiolinea sp.]|nr:diacylglycerol kinase family protein [Thiolinea sp.]
MRIQTQALEGLPAKLPLFINPSAGSAPALLELLRQQERLMIHELKPDQLGAALQAEIAAGTPRVLVCGGDGTLALAASSLAGSPTAMVVVAGGTLNHFAHNWGIPTELEAAVELAFSSTQVTAVDVGYVNESLFLNTSSVGAYVRFVRIRELYEKKMSYRLASIRAGFKSLLRWRSSRLYVNGIKTRSPLIFIGVRERDLSISGLGDVHAQSQAALHVLILKAATYWSLLQLSANIVFKGVEPAAKTENMDSRLVEKITVNNRKSKQSIYVALDGELTLQTTPLEYRYVPNALLVVTPEQSALPATASA